MKALRLIFFLLLLFNVAFLAWQQGVTSEQDSEREPQRLSQQQSPEKLIVLLPRDVQAPAGDLVATVSPPAATPVSSAPATAPTPSAVDAAKPAPILCRALSGFKLAEARQWVAVTAPRVHDIKFSVVPDEAASSYDVLIAALAGKDGAESKLKEIKALGINTPIRTIVDGPDKFALVFATLPTEAEAKTYLQSLTDKGIKTARVVGRIPPTALAQVEMRNLDEARLKNLKEQLASRSDIRIGECLPR